jgi:molybdopterin-synthase adenylyltransferase
MAAIQLADVSLSGKRVAVLGCGSVGSAAAWCLASAGVGLLDLADRDRLETDNLRRHVCGDADVGRPKPAALADHLRRRFPTLVTQEHAFDFLDDPERLRRLLAGADLVLAAVDGEAPKYLLDAAARELSRPAVYAGVYGGGWGAEVIGLDPAGGAPCYGCAARALGRVGVAVDPPAVPAYVGAPPASPQDWRTADLCSVWPCAALASSVAVALLGRSGDPRMWEEWRGTAGACAWRLALRRVADWEAGPWELRPVAVRPDPDCPCCAAGPPDLAALGRLLEGAA